MNSGEKEPGTHKSLRWVLRICHLCLLPVFSILTLYSLAQSQDIARGQVISKVVSTTDAQYSYALYLPSYYTTDKVFPVIYAFEPAARGAYPVARFKEAAEKYGYIMVASNNSKNGLNGTELKPIITDMFADTAKRFSIDQNRIYLTGFSGGARLALGYAVATKGAVAGVIICGAGFGTGLPPATDLPFAIFGTVGDEDFNYSEMRTLDAALSRLNVTHSFVTFSGSHDWASSELCIKAIEWLELQAMKTNRLPIDKAFVESLWKKNFDEAVNAEKQGQSYNAFVLLQALAQDFKGIKDVSAIEARLSSLLENKAVRQALKDDSNEIRKQAELTDQLMSPALDIMQSDGSDRVIKLRALQNLIADVQKKTETTENTSERRVARRSRGAAFAYYYETATSDFLRNKKYDSAILYLQIASELYPKNLYMLVELARVYAVTKQKKQTFQTLQKAVDKGFDDLKSLDEQKDFDSLRGDSEWQKLIEKVKNRSVTKST